MTVAQVIHFTTHTGTILHCQHNTLDDVINVSKISQYGLVGGARINRQEHLLTGVNALGKAVHCHVRSAPRAVDCEEPQTNSQQLVSLTVMTC